MIDTVQGLLQEQELLRAETQVIAAVEKLKKSGCQYRPNPDEMQAARLILDDRESNGYRSRDFHDNIHGKAEMVMNALL